MKYGYGISLIVKIVTIVGARPQFIKCAPLSKELRKKHKEILVHTGQHYDYLMSKVFFEELEIPVPDYNLEVGSGSHAYQTGSILEATEDILLNERPDLVIVFGDTNSTIAGALAAAKLHIDVAHVEAGLRSFDRSMPEEVNRVLTDHISKLLFAPTELAVRNLRKEGIIHGVVRTGDVMVDSLTMARPVAKVKSHVMERMNLTRGGYLVLTVHRQANTDDLSKLSSIIRAVGRSGETIVFPVHPRTKKVLEASGLLSGLSDKVEMIEPLSYVDMVSLMSEASGIVTDSGGMQKEAFLLGVDCITIRDTTEWPETLGGGRNKLVGSDEGKILEAILARKKAKANRSHPFGKPGASKRIARILDEMM